MTRRLLFVLTIFAASACAQSGFAVVVQKGNTATSISKAQLRRMMMGETLSWPGGEKVKVFMGSTGDASRGAALKSICGMSEADFSKHSLQASFEGGAKPVPKSLPTAAAVRQVVQLVAGGIGIVDGDPGPGLKVLPVD